MRFEHPSVLPVESGVPEVALEEGESLFHMVYLGRRLDSGFVLRQAWGRVEDPEPDDGVTMYKKALVEFAVPGNVFQFVETANDTIFFRGPKGPIMVGTWADEEDVVRWKATDMAQRAIKSQRDVNRRAAQDDEVEEAVETLRKYYGSLRTRADRGAFVQYVTGAVTG